jgi:hypothetical protein
MKGDCEPAGLKRFFQRLTLLCFEQLMIQEQTVADYVSSLLTRFSLTHQLYRIRNIQNERLEYVVDMMSEAQSTLDTSDERFNPFRERNIRQHIGDYTLFMTGIFREFVTRNSSLDYYTGQGKMSYNSVSRFDRLAEKEEAELYEDLSKKFEHYSFALDYMKRVYFKDAHLIGPYGASIQSLSEW